MMVEVIVGMAVLLVALSILSRTIAGVSRQRAINHENGAAVAAAFSTFERMRNTDFDRVFARFNADPDDDPGGAGSAPGNRFLVDGLGLDPAAGGFHGEIVFPEVAGELREDVVNADLGMPRDLNNDSVVDGRDHANDYRILPVLIRIRWSGKAGVRDLEIATSLCEFRKD